MCSTVVLFFIYMYKKIIEKGAFSVNIDIFYKSAAIWPNTIKDKEQSMTIRRSWRFASVLKREMKWFNSAHLSVNLLKTESNDIVNSVICSLLANYYQESGITLSRIVSSLCSVVVTEKWVSNSQ